LREKRAPLPPIVTTDGFADVVEELLGPFPEVPDEPDVTAFGTSVDVPVR
jgi:hypothetical protein